MAFLYYPIYLATFYYKDVVGGVVRFFVGIDKYLISLFSISLLLRTYFKPLKNEYRQGLVGFSRVAGIVVKSVLLSVSVSILSIALLAELLIVLVLIFLPFSFVIFA